MWIIHCLCPVLLYERCGLPPLQAQVGFVVSETPRCLFSLRSWTLPTLDTFANRSFLTVPPFLFFCFPSFPPFFFSPFLISSHSFSSFSVVCFFPLFLSFLRYCQTSLNSYWRHHSTHIILQFHTCKATSSLYVSSDVIYPKLNANRSGNIIQII